MRNQVIFRPSQQLLDTDLSKVQSNAVTGFDELVRDGLGAASRYVGFLTSQAGPSVVKVDTGLLYLGGPVHGRDTETTIDMIGKLPGTAKIKAAIVGWGQTADADIERRNFRTDVATNKVEPQDVQMRRERLANVEAIYGQESASPQVPPVPPGYVLIAIVTLGTAGVESIEMQDANRLRSTQDIYQLALANEAWRLIAEPLLSTIRTDLAALAEKQRESGSARLIEQVAYDVALLKERQGVDEDAVSYGADRYLIDDEMDLQHGNSDCRIEEGLRFNWAGATDRSLALYNPIDAGVKVDAETGMMLPAYTETTRNEISGFAGDIAMSQYASQEIQTITLTETRTRVRYGQSRRVCTNEAWWRSGLYDPASGIFRRAGETWTVNVEDRANTDKHAVIRLTQFWVDSWQEPYDDFIAVENTVNGAVIAQTFLNAQGGWYLGSSFEFTDVAATGAVTMVLCEAIQGAPNVKRVIASVTKPVAELQTRPERTRFGVTPVYLERGKRYTRLLITQGAHRIAVADKNSYQEGTLFFGTDGAWFTGDLNRDIVGVDHFAQFNQARTVVELQSVSLSDGITDIDMLFGSVIPEGTEIGWEIQPEGQSAWSRLEAGAAQSLLYNKPAQVKIRAIFNGTSDVQPMMRLTDSELRATRSKATCAGISKVINLPAPSSNITVTSYLEHFDAAEHTATISIYDPADQQIAASVVEDTPAQNGIRRKATFTPAGPISSFRIRHDMTANSDLSLFHVNETVWNGY